MRDDPIPALENELVLAARRAALPRRPRATGVGAPLAAAAVAAVVVVAVAVAVLLTLG